LNAALDVGDLTITTRGILDESADARLLASARAEARSAARDAERTQEAIAEAARLAVRRTLAKTLGYKPAVVVIVQKS
jgi:hypothetical protein